MASESTVPKMLRNTLRILQIEMSALKPAPDRFPDPPAYHMTLTTQLYWDMTVWYAGE